MRTIGQRARMMERFFERRETYAENDPEKAICTIVTLMLAYGASVRTINQCVRHFREREYDR